MSTIRSDNNLYTNPKPAQEYERKLVDGAYVDWDSTDEIDAFFAVPPLSLSYRNNKYFWVAGDYYEFDGSEYRVVGGSLSGSLSFVVGDDPGPPYDGFDGYMPAGSTAIITQLIGKTLISMVWGGVISQCWVPGGQQFLFDTETGEVDNTMLGPWSDGDWVIFNYK